MSKYLGDVSAYAYAESKGYTGTEEEFAELMASYATVAEAAEASAQSAASSASAASGSASTASTAAQTATTKASEASQSATQAESAKTSAQASAQTATTKASEASQSATNAAGSATTANDAADDATAAKTAAETAKTAAEQSATSAATSAQTAQQVLEDIPEDYSDLSNDVSDLKSALYEDTFDGEIVAQETGKYINNNGTIADYAIFSYSELIPVKTGDIITATIACPTGQYSIWYATEGYATKEHALNGGGWNATEQTLVSDRDGYICFSYVTDQTHTAKVTHAIMPDVLSDIEELQDVVTDTLLPTSNAEMTIAETGKYLTDGAINTWDIYAYSTPIPVKKGDKVTIKAYIGPNIYGYYCDPSYAFRQRAFVGDTYAVKEYTFTADRTGYLAVNFQHAYTHTITIESNTIEQLEYTNPLADKMVLWCGDSIMRGNTFNDTGSGWAGRCASLLSFHYKNYAVGGSTICNNVPSGATPTIYTQIETAHTEYPNADYIIFDGGTNDADLIGSVIGGSVPAQFGTFSETDWSGSYNTDTFCGAMETICMHLSQYWLGKHVGYIVPQKQGVANDYSATGNNRRAYYETAMKICKKWGISVLNLWDGCYMNPKHNWMCDTDNTMTQQEIYDAGFLYADRQHLTSEGYDYQSVIVAEWLRSL